MVYHPPRDVHKTRQDGRWAAVRSVEFCADTDGAIQYSRANLNGGEKTREEPRSFPIRERVSSGLLVLGDRPVSLLCAAAGRVRPVGNEVGGFRGTP